MLALSENIGHEMWDQVFSSSQYSAAGSYERRFLSSYFRIVALAAVFATHLLGCSGEAVNVYYPPHNGRSGRIVANHIAYSNYIYHPQIPNLQRYLSRHSKGAFEAADLRPRTRPVANHPSTDIATPPPSPIDL